jgi:putative Mg2+ transporter-C (MgtC) family protein
MYELTNLDVIIRLSVSLICGLMIGFERQINNSIAGIHTNVLVCIGSCLFVFVSYGINELNSPSRIAAQVVTGVGFLGSGVIIKDSSQIKGVNTAATLWVSAAVGCICGSGLWLTGICSSIVVSILNYILRENHVRIFLKFMNIEKEKKEENIDTQV